MQSKSPHSVQIPENTDQRNSEYGHFLRSIIFIEALHLSSKINEGIRDNFRAFFTKRFYTQKKRKMQTSDFHSDVFIRPESIKK